jgi:CRISPR type III-A-associated protein Csm2
MGSLEDAMKKAGLSATQEEQEQQQEGEAPSREKNHARPEAPAPSAPEEKPCAKCGTMFMPKHAKHRLCPKCAEEQFAVKPTGEGARPAPKAESGGDKRIAPKPERRERPPSPRPPRPVQPQETPAAPAPQGFPRDYLQAGYFSGAVLRDDVFDTWARHVAGLLVTRGLSSTQMRTFYSHVLRAQAAARAGRDFREVREDLLRMRPAAAARLGRKAIPGEFADFLDRNLEQVKDPRSLGAFAEHFQAVVGYTAGRLKK